MAAALSPPEAIESAARWGRNADLFAEEVLGAELWSKEREILQAISQYQRVAVKSANGTGKTYTAAEAVLWWIFTRHPAMAVTTAPTWRQVQDLLWGHVNHQFANMPGWWSAAADCLQTRLYLNKELVAVGLSTDDPQRFQGIHSPHLLVVVDEANGLSEPIYEAISSLGSGGEYRELLIGNPIVAEGKFYRAFSTPQLGYHCITIRSQDTPNFTGETISPALAAVLPNEATVRQWALDWGEDSPAFRSRVLAEFPVEGAENILVPLVWFERAKARQSEPLPDAVCQVGVDVARFGSDKTSIATRIGPRLRSLESYAGRTDVVDVAALARIAALALRDECHRSVQVMIDETGVGGGVVDVLQRDSNDGVAYIGVNFGAAPRDAERFVCRRDEIMWGLRELFAEGNREPDLEMGCSGAAVDRLAAQLSSTQYRFNERAKVKIEPKDDMRKRGLPSPDEADAVALAFAAGGPSLTWAFL